MSWSCSYSGFFRASFRRSGAPRVLWLLVVVRLLPFAPSSPVSVFNLLPPGSADANAVRPSPSLSSAPGPIAFPIDPAAVGARRPAATIADAAISGQIDASPADPVRGAGLRSWPQMLFLVWLSGVIVLAAYVIAVAARSADC